MLKALVLISCSLSAGAATPADQPSPRVDENSQRAHLELLEKRKQGQIDLYFLGDSITRRWGAAEAKYAHLLENWRKNFHGWNAANFGWGGDTTQNILWRLKAGELDGVNPKVIAIMAGTNNVGDQAPAANDTRVTDTTRGIQAIVALCREKAPRAKIILMGITPRNDTIAVMPIINRINNNLARHATRGGYHYLSINDQLSDADGKLRAGMTDPDQLHLSAQAYQIWADALTPILTKYLGSRAGTDRAPSPTGDPSAR